MRGLFVGRFQPLHLGHVQALETILDEVDTLTIVVGSAQYSHTLDNPFTAGERTWMLQESLAEAGLEATVIPVVDIHRNSLWVSHIETYVPPFDVTFTNNPLPKRLFAERGYETRGFPLVDRERYEARRIRQLILEGGDWQGLVPKPVARIVEAVDGAARLRDLSGSDRASGESADAPPYDQRR